MTDRVIAAGIMSMVVEALPKKMQGLPHRDQICTLLFDKMSLKWHLYYDIKHDLVHGYADTGSQRSPDVASSAMVVVLAGLTKQ